MNCFFCLQLLATAVCCWRRAVYSSWNTFTNTRRPTEMSNCWLKVFWRACSATELAPVSQHTQAAAHHHNNPVEVKAARSKGSNSSVVFFLELKLTFLNLYVHILFQKTILLDEEGGLRLSPTTERGVAFVRVCLIMNAHFAHSCTGTPKK